MRLLRLPLLFCLWSLATACASMDRPYRHRSGPPAPTPQAHHKRDANAEQHYLKAERFAAQGKYAAAEAQYRAALQIEPHHGPARAGLGYVLYELGHLEEAIQIFRGVLEDDPEAAEVHYWMAEALYLTGAFADAWEHVHRAERYGYRVPYAFRAKLKLKHPEPHGKNNRTKDRDHDGGDVDGKNHGHGEKDRGKGRGRGK